MNSYQKRLREIRFYKQYCRELKELTQAITRKIKEVQPDFRIPLTPQGVTEDSFLTPIDEFIMYLTS